MYSRVVSALCLRESSVQDDSADSLAPSLGKNEEQVEETAAGYDRTRPVLATQSLGGGHPDRYRSLVRQEKPRGGVAQVGPDLLNPGRSVGPNTLTAGEIRLLVDRNRGIDISWITQPNQNRHAKSLELRLKLIHHPTVA